MKNVFRGFILGSVTAVAGLGGAWKYAVTSHNVFTVGDKYYQCNPVNIVLEPE